MPSLTPPRLLQLRQQFLLKNKEKICWFPPHMNRGIIKMQQKLKSVDCILEVHDARVPISGRNPTFKRDFLGIKPHVLVLNKVDLTESRYIESTKEYLKISEKLEHVIYTNCKKENSEGIREIVPVIKNAIFGTERYNRSQNREYGVLIIGVPNVGKSSIINSLRSTFLKKRGCAAVGARAGVTKSVQNRIRISHEPPVFVYDSPGILTPKIRSVDTGMKLAICGTFQDHLVGNVTMADYLLYWLNRNHNHSYMDHFGIEEPCDDINILLVQDAIKRNVYTISKVDGTKKIRLPDVDKAAVFFVEAFRQGVLGPTFLDIDVLP